MSKIFKNTIWLMALLLVVSMTGCGGGSADALLAAQDGSVAPGTCTVAGPKVTSSNPTDGDVNVSTSTAGYTGKLITVNFSEVMDPTTIESLNPGDEVTFTIREDGGLPVVGTVTMNSTNTAATFETENPLDTDTEYEVTITEEAANAAGTSLSCSYRWSFTTAAIAGAAQAPVNLGRASTYGIFAGAAITLATDSLVNGDVGLNPAGACNNCVVGVTVLNGVINNGGALAVQAATDIQAAYDEASVRATGACTLASPSDISVAQGACTGYISQPGSGGIYLPGLYRSATSIGFTGTITLDAQGDDSAVFIFQTGDALTTATGSVVALTGGAKAKNVFWVTYAAATLGVSSTFKGTIISDSAAITVLNGVDPTPLTDVEGRLLAGAGITVNEFATVTVP